LCISFCIHDWGELGLTGPPSDFNLLFLLYRYILCNPKGLLLLTCFITKPPFNSVSN